jgi:cellulose synthase/poly-beta-1,6-N-acetylglucosamine synthase-like glycosyltransferase/peptidoglycan/xylan/chitin deacetylase (PgdA/CDA1 family)/spore germination protein YaaH
MSSPHSSIFADPNGRRRRWLKVTLFLTTITLLGASIYFVSSLLIAPKLSLPTTVRDYRAQLKSASLPPSPLLEMREDWHHLLPIKSPPPFSPNVPPFNLPIGPLKKTVYSSSLSPSLFPIRLGYASSFDSASDLSLKHHSDLLTHVATDWFNLVGVEQKLIEEPNDPLVSFCAHKGLALLPILRNIDGDQWQSEAVEGLLKASPQEQGSFFNHLLERLPPTAIGLLLEWSEIDLTYHAELTSFLIALAKALHEHHRELWITIPTGKDRALYDIDTLINVADHLVATLYDQNSQPDDAGPLAAIEWFQESIDSLITQAKNSDKWVIALGAYSSDWNITKETLEPISFGDAMARAHLAAVDSIDVEAPSFSPYFDYLSQEENRTLLSTDRAPISVHPSPRNEHEVYFLDAITFYNQLHVLKPYRVGGVGIYRLGQEDPDLWKGLQVTLNMELEQREEPSAEELQNLETLDVKHEIASIGSGDFLSVGEPPCNGFRTVTLDEENLLVENYTQFPRPSCVYHQGAAAPHQVAITFDDGPDPTWTPRMLKILKEKKVPATFFILGCQAQQFPDLVQLIQNEGHEFGNHTYTHENLAEISNEKIALELNATTRLLESITGHSTSLFRPPFNGDGNPSTPGELRALEIASELGYLTVGESIDPNDWEQPGIDTIIQRIKNQRAQGGSIILLHDAGGNRSQTLAALPQIIDYLRARGDEIVPLSVMIGLPDDILMPPLRQADVTLATRYIYGSFATLRCLEMVAWSLLVIATIVSLVGILFYIACAIRHRTIEKKSTPSSGWCPPTPSPVTIVIAAYNEERVIISTLEHLIRSRYDGPLELIVVDDGSQDRTAELIEAFIEKNRFCFNRSVLLIRQPNRGKATALNRAIEAAQHELIVTLDADTMVTPRALEELLLPFKDPKVGGVSGHIRVGNPHRWLGRFQQIEYEFAFEINRRAQDFLGCITVLPGALSALRATALHEVGPLQTETLAEDTDLTLQLHRLGWKISYAPMALADTEAPNSIRALLSQRFRWAFGTLQCLWKHRSLLLSPGSRWLGWFALPSIWVFQIGLIALTPVLDILVICSLCWGRGGAIWPYFVISVALDIGLAAMAAGFAGRSKWSSWRALPMRFLYRPLLGYIIWKSLIKAAEGSWVRWTKLERTAAAIKEKREAAGATAAREGKR